MTGSRQGRSARLAALALAGALTLGACGASGEEATTGSGAAAAIVDGDTITVGEVQESSRELAEVISAQAESQGQEPQELGPDTLLKSLVQVPVILDYAKANDLEVPSEGTIRKQVDEVLSSPSSRTIDFFRANAVYSQLDQEQQQEIASKVQEQDVTFSPRYATAGGEGPNWLEQSEDELPFETP